MKTSESKIAFKNIYITFVVSVISLIISFVTSYLINQFAGVSNFGIFNIAISFIPYVTLLLTSIDIISIYRLYKPLAKKDFELANKLMSRSLYEYRTRGLISFFGLMIISTLFPIIFQSNNDIYDNILNGLVLFSGGISSMFIFIFSPVYQKVLTVERKGYLLQIFDLIGNFIMSSVLISIVITNGIYNYFGNIKWIIIISAITKNLASSFGVFIAFHLRKKICPWFSGKMLKEEVGDKKMRRIILMDTIIAQLVLNTSYFSLAIYNNFNINATLLAGIYGNYFIIKSSVSSIFGLIISSPSSSFARMYNNSNRIEVKKIFKIYDYSSFLIGLFAFFIILMVSPFFVSFNTSGALSQINNLNNIQSFNIWMSFLIALSCYIEIARIPCEIFKNIKGDYSWKFKFAVIEAVINCIFTIVGIILSHIFIWMNGLGVIGSLLIANILATGFRYISIKISVIKKFFQEKILISFINEFIFIFILGISFSIIIEKFIKNNIFLDLSWNTVLFFGLLLIISFFTSIILMGISLAINKEYRIFLILKIKNLKKSKRNKTNNI